MRTLLLVALLGVAVVGCGKKRVTPPPEQSVSFGGRKATWHRLTADPCLVDEPIISNDFASGAALLVNALGQTSTSETGTWTEEQLGLLEQLPTVLPPALDAWDAEINQVRVCAWPPESKVPGRINALAELLTQSRTRVQRAPGTLERVRHRQAIEAWKATIPGLKTSAHSDWCPAKPKQGQPDIYFAFEDETGRQEWLFCDDSKVVVIAPGVPPAFQASPTAKKKLKDKPYLDAAAAYPGSDVQHPPKPGDPPPATGPSPETPPISPNSKD